MTGTPDGAGATDYALVLGSNRHPARHLRLALRRIGADCEVVSCTPAVRTRDADGGRYLNAALRVRSGQAFDAIRAAMHTIEEEAGRMRGTDEVALDIDVVASIDAAGALRLHKPDDLERGYVRTLLQRIGF